MRDFLWSPWKNFHDNQLNFTIQVSVFCICSVDTRVMFLGNSSILFYIWRPHPILLIHSTMCLLQHADSFWQAILWPVHKARTVICEKNIWRLLSFSPEKEKCLFMVMAHFKKSCWHRHAAWLQPALARYFILHVLSYGGTFTEEVRCTAVPESGSTEAIQYWLQRMNHWNGCPLNLSAFSHGFKSESMSMFCDCELQQKKGRRKKMFMCSQG